MRLPTQHARPCCGGIGLSHCPRLAALAVLAKVFFEIVIVKAEEAQEGLLVGHVADRRGSRGGDRGQGGGTAHQFLDGCRALEAPYRVCVTRRLSVAVKGRSASDAGAARRYGRARLSPPSNPPTPALTTRRWLALFPKPLCDHGACKSCFPEDGGCCMARVRASPGDAVCPACRHFAGYAPWQHCQREAGVPGSHGIR